jgi:hypothetical protein
MSIDAASPAIAIDLSIRHPPAKHNPLMLHHRIYKAMGAMAISEATLLILFCCFCSPIFGGKSQEPFLRSS